MVESPVYGEAGGVKFRAELERSVTEPDQAQVWVVYVGEREIGRFTADPGRSRVAVEMLAAVLVANRGGAPS